MFDKFLGYIFDRPVLTAIWQITVAWVIFVLVILFALSAVGFVSFLLRLPINQLCK